MSDNKTTDVLVSTDGGATWSTHSNVPGAPAAAIKRVRDTNPELTANPTALFAPLGAVTIYARQMVEQFEPVKGKLGDMAIVEAAAANSGAAEAPKDGEDG